MGLNMDLRNMPYTEQLQFYVNHMHPLINKNALFADGTAYYRSFIKHDRGYTAVLRFRTGVNNVESVRVVMDGREIAMERFMSILYLIITKQSFLVRTAARNTILRLRPEG